MELTAIYANLSCSDLGRSLLWFTRLLDRQPDARPMDGLVEWHHGAQGGFQLHENAQKAGQGTLTLIVTDIRVERHRLMATGLQAGRLENADDKTILRLSDSDGNLVVLVQPNRR